MKMKTTFKLAAVTLFATWAALCVRGEQEPWVRWARNPVTIPVTVIATNIQADLNSSVIVSLSDGSSTQLGAGCSPGTETNAGAFVANMKVRRECLLTVVASNLTSLNLQLAYKPNWTPPHKTRRESRVKTYRLLVDRVWNQDGQISVNNPSACTYYSNAWRVELNERLPANWRLEDSSNDPQPPGDGTWAEIGPGMSLEKSRASIAWSVSLGRLFDGVSAGRLSLRESGITPETYSPTNLFYTAGSELVRDAVYLITQAPGSTVLRQVKATQAFVDLVWLTNTTELRFYSPTQVGTGTNSSGIYTNITGNPFVVWSLRNPNAPNTNKLQIIEQRNGVSSTNEITCDTNSSTATWTLRYGKGATERLETRGVQITTGATTNRVETVDVRYAADASPAYRAVETYRLFPWGLELVETRIDPDNDVGTSNDLVTSFAFYTDPGAPESYGKPWIITHPDGYWEERLYDNTLFLGALQYVLHPDRDSPSNPTNAALADCMVDDYQYDWHLGDFGNLWAVRTLSHPDPQDMSSKYATRINLMNRSEGDSVNRTLDYLSIPHDQEAVGNFPGPMVDGGSVIGVDCSSPDEFWGLGYFGHDFVRSDTAKGTPLEVSYFHSGTYDTNTQTFTAKIGKTSEGPDWRQCTIYTGLSDLDDPTAQVSVSWAEGEPLYTIGSLQGVSLYPYRSWRNSFIYHGGTLVQKEMHIFTGVNGVNEPQFAPVATWVYGNDTLGHMTNVVRVDGNSGVLRTIYNADYRGTNSCDGDLLLSETDEQGIKTIYSYDSLKRLATSIKEGFATQTDITTSVAYDAVGRVLGRTNSAGGLNVGSSASYDLAGRVKSQVDTNGLTTSLSYELGGRRITKTLPNGLTEIRDNYLDRRLKSVTGTGVVNEFHDWNFLPLAARGTNLLFRVATVHSIQLGNTNSARIVKEGIDLTGRVIRRETPDWGLTNAIVEYTGYFSRQYSRPSCFFSSVRGEELAVWANYLEFDGSTNLCSTPIEDPYTLNWTVLSSKHRLSSSTWQYNTNQAGEWFRFTTNFTYRVEDTSTPTLVGIRQERLNGFSSSATVSEIVTWDADTNATVQTAAVDRPSKKLTETTDVPFSTLNIIRISTNGLLQTETTASVSQATRYSYDSLGRQIGVLSSLGFSSSAGYNSSGQLETTTDFTGLKTTFSYFPSGQLGAGQLKSMAVGGKVTFYGYTNFGIWRTWGDVPYPEERLYSQFGELVELHTFRGGNGWNGLTWPVSAGSADKTVWVYQEASGLLGSKADHNGNSVRYTYNRGLVVTREWARGVTVTSAYDDLGELVRTDYPDGTSVMFTNSSFPRFDRQAHPQVVLDGAGTTLLGYDHAGRLVSSSCSSGLLAGITVSNHFDRVYGRDVMKVTGASAPVTEQFGYDSFGRLTNVWSGVYSAGYEYLPGSDLLRTTSFRNNGANIMTTTRSWEYGSRLGAIVNQTNGVTLTSHGYRYDALNRRTQAVLEDGSVWGYSYNDRNELVGAGRYWPDWSPAAGQQFGYAFDNIGNRKNASSGGDVNGQNLRPTSYTANNLNQYTSVSTPGYEDIIGLAFGTNAVTVNGGTADRKGEYFHREINIANGSGPLWQTVQSISGGVTNQGGLVFPDDSQVLAYDLDGNLTFDGTWTYEWDGENRLKTMVMTNVVNIPPTNRFRLDFAYDFQGRRVQKIVSTNSTGNAFVPQSTNRFVYDSWNLVAALNPSFALQQSFLWGQDLSGTMDGAGGVGGLVALCEYSGGQLADANFCAFDGNGNVAALTKASSFQTTARYEYSPFGETMRATGPLAKANPFRFSTKFWDEETGLVYYGQRYYSSSKGGWLGRDPAEAKVRGSTYSFVQNRPIDLIDPDGMVPLNPAVAAQILTALLLWNATAFASGNFIAGELDDEMLEWTEKTMMGNSGAPKPPIKRGPKTPRPPKSAPNPTANRVRRWIQRGPHYGGMFSIVGGILAINGTAATVSQFGALTQTVADFAGHAVAGETAWADLDAATFAAQLQGNGSDYLFTMSMLNNLLQLEETR